MPQVDLQAISIDPTSPQVKPGQKFEIVVAMKNNGPDVLPAGEGTCQITLSATHLRLGYNIGLRSTTWKLLGVDRKIKGQYNLFFETKTDMGVNEEDTGFRFEAAGKTVGTSMATLASSLSATATSSDVDGQNQSVSCEIIVIPKRKYTKKA